MSEGTVTVNGIGLCSALGGFHDACAAYRAGLNRFAAHPDMKTMQAGDEEPVELTVAPAATNVWQYQGVARTVKMLHLAYQDLLENMRYPVPMEGLQLLLAMPDPEDRALDMGEMPNTPRAERLQSYIDAVTVPLLPKMGSAFQALPVQCVFGDRVAFVRIIQKALDMISAGQAQHCLLMVADSLLDDVALDAQMEKNLIKHGGNPVGYIPGEGAAFLLLSANPPQKPEMPFPPVTLNLVAEMDTSIVDEEDEDAELKLWQGEKLYSVVRRCLRLDPQTQQFPMLISDINGEEHRAIELGGLQVKARTQYPQAAFTEAQATALGFGELGTMFGPVSLASLVASAQRKYLQQREVLMTFSEANGKRAAMFCKI